MDGNWNGLAVLLLMGVMGTGSIISTVGDSRSLRLRELAYKDFAMVRRLKVLSENRASPLSLAVLSTANEYVADFESGTTSLARINVTEHAEQAVRNPLFGYKVVARVMSLFEFVTYGQAGTRQLHSLVERELANFDINTVSNELSDAVDAILRIQFTYNLPAVDLVAGKLGGIQTEARLNAFNCIQIGFRAKKELQLALAVEWLKEAVRLAKTDGTLDIPTARAELLETIQLHNLQWRKNNGLSKKHLFMRLLKPSDIDMVETNIPKIREALEIQYAGKGRSCSYWPMNNWGLCSDTPFNAQRASPHLFCWLEFKAHKILTVGPLKIEFISRDPDIVQIYDAFRIQSVSRAVVENMKDDKNKISASSYLETVLAAPGLTTAGNLVGDTVTFQITASLPGAQSERKFGWHESNGSQSYCRGATLFVHINDVEAGGCTVFPAALGSSLSAKGSALFWFSALSDGSIDFSTSHAPCPVILGHKLAAHKWLRFSQCLLKPKERFQVLVNGELLPVPTAFHHELITQKDYENPKPLTTFEHRLLSWFEGDSDDGKLRKYGYNSIRSLKPLIRLDLDIYQNVHRIMASKSALLANTSTEDMASSYLETFNERAYHQIMANSSTRHTNEALVSKLEGSPVAVYRAISRFENYLKKWITYAEEGTKLPTRLRTYIQEVYSNVNDGPTYKDLEYSIVGILSMQQAYNLETEDISKGLVAGVEAGIQLTPSECIQFGYQAIMSDFLFTGVQWMETALSKMTSNYPGLPPVKQLEEAQLALETAKEAHDIHLRRSKGKHSFTYSQPVADFDGTTRRLKTNKEVQYNKYKFSMDFKHARINYYGLCQGKTHQLANEQSKLFCWYETDMDLYWKIGPLKAELLSMHPKPEVVLFHDLLTQQDMQFLRNDTNHNKPHDFRLSYTAGRLDPVERLGAILWHNLNSSQESAKIMKLVQKVTGLKIVENTWAMQVQIGVYTPGSHYNVHHDTVSYGKEDEPSRMATFMFYVNDVEKGGATAFAQAGVRVPPKAGSAVLWYNLLSSGVLDTHTSHGSCPVIFGEKLIATHWLYYGDQAHLKCHVDKTRRMEVFVNGKSKYAL